MATQQQIVDVLIGKPADAPAQSKRGVQLPCPHCGESSATISLSLADMTLTCQECNAEFTTQDVRDFIAAWQPVLAWIDTVPVTTGE